MKIKILFICFLLIATCFVFAQNSTKQGKKKAKKSLIQNINEKNADKQYEIRSKISRLMRLIKKEKDTKTIFLLFLMAFLYGIFHSLGPGHGKLLITSTFLTDNATILRGLYSGISFAFTHSISGIILVLILKLLDIGVFSNSDKFINISQKISFSILILLGLYLIYRGFTEKERTKRTHNKSFYTTVLVIALVPCPASVIIALFSLKMELFGLGILLILTMALGMSVTISSIGIITAIFKNSFLKIFEKKQGLYEKVFKVITVSGGLFLFLLALLFLLF